MLHWMGIRIMIVPSNVIIFKQHLIAGERPLKLAPVLLIMMLGLFGGFTVAQASQKPDIQVVVEGGWAIPYGNLGQDFHATPLGFGASSGFEAGFRIRYYISPSFSISPAFHFLNPGDFASESEVFGEYSLQANSYRYTVELMLAQPEPRLGFQPFLAGGMGLYRNRYQGFTKPFVQEFDRSVNTLGFSVRAGVLVRGFELSWVYNFNRFSSYQFFDGNQEYDYNWDNMTLRIGWVIPFENE